MSERDRPAPGSRVDGLFDAVARVYDTSFVQRLVYRPNQDLVMRRLRAAGSKRILDVGCGTGILTARMADELRPEIVCGCDLSSGMLEQASGRTSEARFVRGDSAQLPFADGAFDAVVSTEAFHFFDQPRALAEFHRVLAAGGRLLVALINPRTSAGSRVLRAQAGRVLGAGTWPPRSEMRRLVEGAGFGVVSQRRVNRIMGLTLPTVLTEAVRRMERSDSL